MEPALYALVLEYMPHGALDAFLGKIHFDVYYEPQPNSSIQIISKHFVFDVNVVLTLGSGSIYD